MRPLTPGTPVAVAVDGLATPVRLRLWGQWQRVLCVEDRYRVRQHWWRQPRWREYITLLTDAQLLLTLGRDLPHGAWTFVSLAD